jgi:hypothetical protein
MVTHPLSQFWLLPITMMPLVSALLMIPRQGPHSLVSVALQPKASDQLSKGRPGPQNGPLRPESVILVRQSVGILAGAFI